MRDPLFWYGLFYGFYAGLVFPFCLHFLADIQDRSKGDRLNIESRERRQMSCKSQ